MSVSRTNAPPRKPLARVAVTTLEHAQTGTTVSPRGADGAHHLLHVLRARDGDAVVLFDGAGRTAHGTVRLIVGARRKDPNVELSLDTNPIEGVREDRARVIVLQGIPRGEKLEQVVRQSTELGVRALWPVQTERSVFRESSSPTESARWRERLEAVAWSAAAQSGRSDVSHIGPVHSLAQALRALPSTVTVRLVPWEEGGESMGEVLHGLSVSAQTECAVLIGPEGGLTVNEVDLAKEHGFRPVTLGPRILRTETVAPVMLALLSVFVGDLRVSRD